MTGPLIHHRASNQQIQGFQWFIFGGVKPPWFFPIKNPTPFLGVGFFGFQSHPDSNPIQKDIPGFLGNSMKPLRVSVTFSFWDIQCSNPRSPMTSGDPNIWPSKYQFFVEIPFQPFSHGTISGPSTKIRGFGLFIPVSWHVVLEPFLF